MFSKDIVTLNIESGDVRLLVARGKRIRYWSSMPLAPGIVRDGSIADPEMLSSTINTLFLKAKMPRRRVVVSLTGLRSVSRIISLPNIKSNLLERAIQNESEREMPVSLGELYLSWQLLGAKDAERQFFVLGVPRNLLDTEVQTLVQAGINPYVINLKPLALARVVNREEALIIDLEPEHFDLVAVVGGIPVIMRTVISRGEGMTSEDRIMQLKSELSRTVEFYNSSHPEHTLSPTTPAFLTGLQADDTSTCELVKGAIDHPVETLVPSIECPPDLPLAQYVVNIGLALGQALPKTTAKAGTARLPISSLNVLPDKYKAPPLWSTQILLYPIVSMLLITLLFLTCQMYYVKVGSEEEIAGIQAKLHSINQQLDQISQPIATINDTEAEADSLKEEREAILGTVSFTDNLQLILGSVPSGVRIISITETEEQIGLDGDADSRSRVIDYVAALEQTGGFSKVYIASLSGGGNDSLVTFNIVCIVNYAGTTQ